MVGPTPTGMPMLSVVIPAYNEESRLPRTIGEVSRHLAAVGLAYELLVVDDGSTDATSRVVKDASAEIQPFGCW